MGRRWAIAVPGVAFTAGCALLLLTPRPADEGSWDLLNGAGVAAFVLLVWVLAMAPASAAGYSRATLRWHLWLGVAVAIATAVHVIGLLISNAVLTAYLTLRAPLYMHAGTLATIGLLPLSLLGTSRLRRRWHRDFRSFVRAHRILSLAVLGLAAVHIGGSGYLLPSAPLLLVFALLLSGFCLWWWCFPLRRRWPESRVAGSVRRWLLALAVASMALVLLYLVSRS